MTGDPDTYDDGMKSETVTTLDAALNNVVLIPLAVLLVLSIVTIRPRPPSAASSDATPSPGTPPTT